MRALKLVRKELCVTHDAMLYVFIDSGREEIRVEVTGLESLRNNTGFSDETLAYQRAYQKLLEGQK